MSWLNTFISSSIGKKILMATSGSFLMLFLVIHLIGNFSLFAGPDAFNNYVITLSKIKPLIRFMELILLIAFVVHIYKGISLWFENRKAKPIKYKVNASSENSSIFSRTMIFSGSIIFIFLILHLGTFFWRFNVYDPMGFADKNQYYQIVIYFFNIWWYVLLYIVAMILLGFHLNHGFQSAFQTFGLNNKKFTPLIKKIGTLYAIVMAIGFAIIPIYFYFTGDAK